MGLGRELGRSVKISKDDVTGPIRRSAHCGWAGDGGQILEALNSLSFFLQAMETIKGV